MRREHTRRPPLQEWGGWLALVVCRLPVCREKAHEGPRSRTFGGRPCCDHDVRLDEAGRDRVHADALGSELGSRAAGGGDKASLGCAVETEAERGRELAQR